MGASWGGRGGFGIRGSEFRDRGFRGGLGVEG